MVRDEEKRMIGKRIRIIELAGENDLVNNKYSGREGIIASIDDIGQYHVIWDGTDGVSGLAINPQEDDYEIINFLESAKPRRNHFGRNRLNKSFEDKTLNAEIKKHGGLDNLYKDRDARAEITWYELSKEAGYKSYIPKEDIEKIRFEYYLNPHFSLYEQILFCKDGGAIVIGKELFPSNYSYLDSLDKEYDRNKHFENTYKKSLNKDYPSWDSLSGLEKK